ncbi:cation diffusion facilitator family transporter [Conservatibacter flavescens]|uniref:Cation-efflux pump FieF n=1 Tax=Conservatibacter flavescens TaxID=28161 RepID=A0A2M8S0K0_9PAST|nr:cation diffusion facilitator family transporter [Conservatibacter flavescens]PJG84673.1 divalent metal cation transporter FieF [Conservatibacter flavescens]
MTESYSKEVRYATVFAVLTALILVCVKSVAWWFTGSVSMLASITDSLLDLLASFMNMLILRFALMPADHNHSFGHGKAESLASLAQAAFISGSAIFLLLQGIHRLSSPQTLTNTGLGIGVTIFSILLTALLVGYQGKVIRNTQSPAIKADRLHYQTDLLMNIAILISLLLSLFGFLYADAIFALFIALYILFSAGKMVFESVQLLLDVALPIEEVKQIETIALADPRVIGLHDIRTRRAGAIRFIQLHLELGDELSFIEAHDITDDVEKRLLKAFPLSDIMIHQEPTSIVKAEGKHNCRYNQSGSDQILVK